LRHDFSAGRGKGFGDSDYSQSASKRGEKQREDEKRDDLRGRPGFNGQVEGDEQAQEESETKEKVRCEGGGPHSRTVDARDFDLAVGKFEEGREVRLNVGRGEAFGQKNDLAAGSFDGDGEGVVVAESVLPDIEHVHLFKEGAANGGAAAPTEISRMAAEHSDHGSVPGGEKGVGESVVVGNEPTHGGGGSDAGIGERSDDMVKPGSTRAAVRIYKDEHLKIGGELFNTDAEVVHFFAGCGGLSGDDDVSFHAGGRGDALDEAVRGIIFGSEDEKDLEVLMVEFAKRNEIAFEAGFHAAARAEDCGAGSVKARVGVQSAAHVGEPLDALPEQEEPRGDLENRQKFEESFHASRA